MTFTPYEIIGQTRPSRWLVACDHASNKIPATTNNASLGLPQEDMDRHIAYDVGAAGVSTHLADLLDARGILSRFSRLVIDPNRGEDDPTLMMRVYDGTIIPGNRHADTVEIKRRLDTYYRPYHTAYDQLAARQDNTIIVAVHSFTPRLNGRSPRPWHIGILYAHDDRLAKPLLENLRLERDLCVGENEPYDGHLPGDAVDRHALQKGRPNALIELRHDLIANEKGQREWAERLAPILQRSLVQSGL